VSCALLGLARHILFHLFANWNNSLKTFHDFVPIVRNGFVFTGSVLIYIFALVIVRALLPFVRACLIIIINDRYPSMIGCAEAYRDLCPRAVGHEAPPGVGFQSVEGRISILFGI